MVTFPKCLTKGENLKISYENASASSFTVYVRGAGSFDLNGALNAVNVWEATGDTSSLAAGEYMLEAWAEINGENLVVARERFTLQATLQDQTADVDFRSNAEKIVEAIEGFLASNGATYKRYQINNRELERYSIAELLKLLTHYKAIAANQKRKEQGKSVFGPGIEVRI